MFRAILDGDRVKRWVRFLAPVAKLLDEACIWLSWDGLMIRDVDPSRISLINFSLSRDYFSEFEFSGEGRMPVSVDSKKLLEFSALLRNMDELIVTLDPDGFLRLASLGPYEKEVGMPVTIDSEASLPELPEIDYKASVEMMTASLISILREARSIGDTIAISAAENEIQFSSENDEGFGMLSKLRYPENMELLDIMVTEPSRSRYHFKPLIDVLNELSPISRTAVLRFKSDAPLFVEFRLQEGEKYELYLAPKAVD